jgi:4-hydroxyproline epimerase
VAVADKARFGLGVVRHGKDDHSTSMFPHLDRIHVVDSHTGGEPTRVIVSGGPSLPAGSMSQKLECLRRKFDHFRTAAINEPRGSDIIVGALLCEPEDPANTAGVIYFNNVGYLGMCVHGTIGLIITLAYLGKIHRGRHNIESPVGTVLAQLHDSGEVTVENVPSYRFAANVPVEVPGYGIVRGDIAWGGNWFFLVDRSPIEISFAKVDELEDFARAIREALQRNHVTAAGGQEIDHVELFSDSELPGVDSKNFVLCPGHAYDRSPCGTGTSAKLACLYGNGKLQPGQIWRQESIIGSVFEGSVRIKDKQILPSIKGSAFITSEADLILDPKDAFCHGLFA